MTAEIEARGARTATCEQQVAVPARPVLGRRRFLRAICAGAAVGTTVPFGLKAVGAGEAADKTRKARYRASEHVKIYYQVNRYPI